MPVEFILGRTKSGKTMYCYNQIAEELKKDQYNDLIMLVPEQFNLQTQMNLSKRLYPGLLRVEVKSFNTLAREVFKEVGKPQMTVIDDLERMMILRKIIEEHKTELIFFKKNIQHQGFLEAINHLITVFEQDAIDEQILNQLIHDGRITLLFKNKLQDIRLIYQYFEDYIKDQFMTAEKTLHILGKSIYKSEKLEHTMIWIDGFYGFTAVQIEIIKELIKKSNNIKITLPADKVYEVEEKILETNPFYESIKTYQRLRKVAQQQNSNVLTQYLSPTELDEDKSAKEIVYIEKNYFNRFIQPFKAQTNHIKLNVYIHTNKEVEEAAKRITELIRDQGYRYRDIAIIVGQLSAYQPSIQSIFEAYEIPYFLDMKRSVYSNRLIAVIECVLEVITMNYSYKSIMALLRTYMLQLDLEAIDLLDNYILAYGIKGKQKWHEEWQFEKEELELQEHINQIRKIILKPIDKLEENIKNARTNGTIQGIELTRSLYHFLEEIQAYESLQACIEYYQKENNRLLELENTQIWDQVIEVFDRLVNILGQEAMTLNTYKKILSTSFSYLKMGIIPPSQDQVLIGTIDRTRLPQVKAVFVLGTNEGVIPQTSSTNDLFSDMDKTTLTNLCQSGDYGKERLYETLVNQPIYSSNFLVYTALTRATHRLYVSAITTDQNGKALRLSSVYYKLKKMFSIQEVLTQKHILDEMTKPLPTFGVIGRLLREDLEGRITEFVWKDAVSWYFENKVWHDRLTKLSSYLFYTNQQHYLDKATTELLYDTTLKTSISKLECFRSCACNYFMRYAVKAKQRKVFSLDQSQIGILLHRVLELYPQVLRQMHITWQEANKEQLDSAVQQAVNDAMKDYYRGYKEGSQFKYTVSQLQRMSKRAISALTTQLKNSDFIPTQYELSFGEGEELKPIEIIINEIKKIELTGQIDRVDLYTDEKNHCYVKILDYKTGHKHFNLLEVYHGLQLQLLLYLQAYIKLSTMYKPGGIFYFHIQHPYVNYQAGMSESDLQEACLKQFKLSGLALENVEILNALDKNHTGHTMPINFNKDGSIKKGSSVALPEQFQCLQQHVIERIKCLGEQILEGNVSAKPFKIGDKNPCVYCEYSAICQFDETLRDNTYEKLESLSKDEIWEKLSQKPYRKESE